MLRAYASGRIFGERFGEGPVRVLALHGWRRSHGDFAPMLEGPLVTSSPTASALALDLPGHGASPEPPGPWGSPDYAALVAEILETAELPLIVVGHSFGGRVAVHLADRRPEAVAGLVLTGVPQLVRLGEPPRPALAYRALRRLARAGVVAPSRLEAARHRYGSEDYRAARGVMRSVLVALAAERYEEQLARLTCPVELVWGEHDAVVPMAVAEAAATLIARARLTVVPGVGHMTPLEAPDALRDAIGRLL